MGLVAESFLSPFCRLLLTSVRCDSNSFSDRRSVGSSFSNHRQNTGLSQGVYAERLGVSIRTVKNCEHGWTIPSNKAWHTIYSIALKLRPKRNQTT